MREPWVGKAVREPNREKAIEKKPNLRPDFLARPRGRIELNFKITNETAKRDFVCRAGQPA